MPPFKAFADIQTPHDLLQKLERNFQRMQQDGNDVYSTFDFFVTAEHIVDWVSKSAPEIWARIGASSMTNLKTSTPILQVTAHIANGAKHFEATDTRYNTAVDAVEVRRPVQRGYVADDYAQEPVFFVLSDDLTQKLGLDAREISANALATLVLDYWREALSAAG